MIGAALQAGARDIPMLFIGRVILGGGIGFANQVLGCHFTEKMHRHALFLSACMLAAASYLPGAETESSVQLHVLRRREVLCCACTGCAAVHLR